MRVLLSTIGSRGDVQPLVALALALRARGAEVRVCAPPDFGEWIEAAGIAAVPIGPELRRLTAAPGPPALPSEEQRRRLAEATVVTQFETVARAAEGCDAIVAATALQIAARSVAERLRIPYVFAAYCPAVLPSAHHAPIPLPMAAEPPPGASNRELWARDAARFNDLFGAALNAHRTSLGMDPVDDVRGHVFTNRPWLAADPTLGPWPEPGGVFQPGAWILPDERPLPPELEAFLAGGEAPVFFGLGSMRAPEGACAAMIGAARALGRRALVSRGWADLSPIDDAPDCLAVGEVNQQALFARVAAVVHHGGAGTTTTAALAGAPQVVVPQLYDQRYWAQRVEELGAGATATTTAESLTAALARALAPAVAARARALAADIRRDGAAVAAGQLLGDA